MAQRQWRSDDTDNWAHGFGSEALGAGVISSSATASPVNTTATGTAGTRAVTAGSTALANGDIVIITQSIGTGMWELNVVESGGGTTSLTMAYDLMNTYTSGAQIVKFYEYSSLTINSGVTWTAPAWNGSVGGILPLMATGTVTITGSISANSRIPGGAAVSGDSYGWDGRGWGDPQDQSTTTDGSGGGAGIRHLAGVYNPSAGGGGGNATAGATSTAKTNPGSAGSGGQAAGNSSLTLLGLPGGGGSGGGKSGGGTSGAGGYGGGIIVIIASNIVITGSIVANGANGGAPSCTSDACGDGGGGGAGGSVLLKCQTATLGTNKITCSYGSGNTSGSHSNGGNGAWGRIHMDYSGSYSGSTSSPAINVTNDTTIVPIVATNNYLRRYRRTRLPGAVTTY